MLKLCRVTKLKVFFPVLVYVFNFSLFELILIFRRHFGEGSIKVAFPVKAILFWQCKLTELASCYTNSQRHLCTDVKIITSPLNYM